MFPTGLRGALRTRGVNVVAGEPWDFNEWPTVGGVAVDDAMDAAVAAGINESCVKSAVVALAAVDTAGGLFKWLNPEAVSVLVVGFDLVVTTKSTATCTVDCGLAANGTTSDDELIDGQDVNAAVGIFRATVAVKVDKAGGTKPYLTGSKATGATAGIVGYAVIRYLLLPT